MEIVISISLGWKFFGIFWTQIRFHFAAKKVLEQDQIISERKMAFGLVLVRNGQLSCWYVYMQHATTRD